MGERKMYNFPFVEDGQTYWRSRSCTTVGYVFCADKDGYLCVLANQRGPGAPTNVGKWNVPCGYIDFRETGDEGVARETFEETGVKLKPEQFNFDSVSFSKDGDENINLRYWVKLSGITDDYPLSNAANEEGETSDIRWIRLCDVKNYEWAFGQGHTIFKMANHVEYTVYENGIQNVMPYLVQISEVTYKTNECEEVSNTSLIPIVLCDTIEKCKEYVQKHMVEIIKVKKERGFDIMNQELAQNSLLDFSSRYGLNLLFDKVNSNGEVTEITSYMYLFTPIEKYE